MCVFPVGPVLSLFVLFYFPSLVHRRSSQAVETCLIYCLCKVLMHAAEKGGAFVSHLPVLVKAVDGSEHTRGWAERLLRALVQLGLFIQHVDAWFSFPACPRLSARAACMRLLLANQILCF